MANSSPNRPSEGHVLPKAVVRPTDEELLQRLLESEWRDDLLDDLGNKDEIMRRLFDMALNSLKRTNATASKMVKDSAAFRNDFDTWLSEFQASQRKTRAMIEDLVNGR